MLQDYEIRGLTPMSSVGAQGILEAGFGVTTLGEELDISARAERGGMGLFQAGLTGVALSKSYNPDLKRFRLNQKIPRGSSGWYDHRKKVRQIRRQAIREKRPSETVLQEKKIAGLKSRRKPDVQIVDERGIARKVFEAEREPLAKRNLLREAEYRRLGIEFETHPLPPERSGALLYGTWAVESQVDLEE